MFEDNKQMEREMRELAAAAHLSINGFMRVVREGDQFPIVFCNQQVCNKLQRDPSNIIGKDFHICFDGSFDEWHRPLMMRWFDNPQDIVLDRQGTSGRPFEMVDSKGGRHPVGVHVRSRPSYPTGSMFAIDAAPQINPGAWVEIVFQQNIHAYRELRRIVEVLEPHLRDLIGVTRGHESDDGVGEGGSDARQRSGVNGAAVGGCPHARNLEPDGPDDSEDKRRPRGGERNDDYGNSKFETSFLDD